MQSPLAFAIRHQQWKLALTPGSGSRGMWGTLPFPEQAWGDALRSFGSKPGVTDLRKAPFVQLFDLDQDVRETNNLASDRPEVAARLAELLDKTIEDGRSTPGPALENDVPRVELHRNSTQWIKRHSGTGP